MTTGSPGGQKRTLDPPEAGALNSCESPHVDAKTKLAHTNTRTCMRAHTPHIHTTHTQHATHIHIYHTITHLYIHTTHTYTTTRTHTIHTYATLYTHTHIYHSTHIPQYKRKKPTSVSHKGKARWLTFIKHFVLHKRLGFGAFLDEGR